MRRRGSRNALFRTSIAALSVTALSLACDRNVEVTPADGSGGGTGTGARGDAGGGSPRTDLIDGIDQGQTGLDGGTAAGDLDGAVTTGGRGGGGPSSDAGQGWAGATGGHGSGGSGGGDTGSPADSGGAAGSSSPAGTGGSAGQGGSTTAPGTGGFGTPTAGGAITDLQVLVDGLNAIHVPAVGAEGVALLQYTSTGAAMVLQVAWNGLVKRWHESVNAYHIYAAANGTRYPNLLYDRLVYPVYENGAMVELSGAHTTYKEFLAANQHGFAWVDYGVVTMGAGGSPGGSFGPGTGGAPTGTTTLGKITFRRWDGTRAELTDATRYRARIELSDTHIAYVEYASTTPGTIGQVLVQPLSGGAAFAAAPSPLHQDRPAVDGDWVVWEEYVGGPDAVIRARNLVTGEVRDLSARAGFRTNPDIRGTRVIWEDQRSGSGDIYYRDLGSADGERVAVSGAGHSTGPRHTADGLVWIEVNGNNMGILRARWAP
jgi:beta propeller repeat protein